MTSRAGIETTLGTFVAEFSELGLRKLAFPQPAAPHESTMERGPSVKPQHQPWQELTTSAVRDVLAGRQPTALPPLDWSGHTEFRQEVWRALLRIRLGQTRTYSEVAAELGKPLASRATGGACGANPIPVLVPCHRVVAANGGLGGFSGGLEWKRHLLAVEVMK